MGQLSVGIRPVANLTVFYSKQILEGGDYCLRDKNKKTIEAITKNKSEEKVEWFKKRLAPTKSFK